MTLAQLINVLYNIVDRIYIGRLEQGNALELTGLGVCLPVIYHCLCQSDRHGRSSSFFYTTGEKG